MDHFNKWGAWKNIVLATTKLFDVFEKVTQNPPKKSLIFGTILFLDGLSSIKLNVDTFCNKNTALSGYIKSLHFNYFHINAREVTPNSFQTL